MKRITSASCLDAPGFAEVRHLRSLVLTRFGVAAQLGYGDHGDAEFLGETLEGAGDLGDLLAAVFHSEIFLHELEVVDNDQAETCSPLAGGLWPQFKNRQRGRVIDEDRGVGEGSRGKGQVWGQSPFAQETRADSGSLPSASRRWS